MTRLSSRSIWRSGGTRYTYGFKLDDERVRAEWLHAYPKGRRQVWFDRGDDGKITFPGEGLRGDKQELARRTRRDSLFLTVARDPQPPAVVSCLSVVQGQALANQSRSHPIESNGNCGRNERSSVIQCFATGWLACSGWPT